LPGDQLTNELIASLTPDRLGVDQDDDGIEAASRPAFAIPRDCRWVGNATGLDDDLVGSRLECKHLIQTLAQRIGNGTADTAVGQADRLAVVTLDQLDVDIDRAEVVDQHRQPAAMISGEQGINQRCFPRAEVAADDRHRYQRRTV